MGKVLVENIKAYSYHGCLDEETRIGSDYLVNVMVTTDLSKASRTDALKDTIDYVHINKIVKEEMAIPSKLLEHVAQRIMDRMFNEIIQIQKGKVSVSKINPPINGDVEKVTVTLKKRNSSSYFPT